MDNKQQTLTLLTMLLFFVLQGLIYVACLAKLAEIRLASRWCRGSSSQAAGKREDHLFDAGLYLGFVGQRTYFADSGFVGDLSQLSLMAAYSSTSFGIIFVTVFKIFHLQAVYAPDAADAGGRRNPCAVNSRLRPRPATLRHFPEPQRTGLD